MKKPDILVEASKQEDFVRITVDDLFWDLGYEQGRTLSIILATAIIRHEKHPEVRNLVKGSSWKVIED